MNTISIPKSWSDISVSQFIELSQLKKEDFETEIDYLIEHLAILTNRSSNDSIFDEMSYSELVRVSDQILFIKTQPSIKHKKNIGDLYLFDFNKIKLGEFIDAEYYLNDITKLCSIFYKKRQEDNFGNFIIEPYDNVDINSRSEYFLEIPITYVYGVSNEYQKFRTKIFDDYSGLFANRDIVEDEVDMSILKNRPEILEKLENDKKEIEKEESINNKWGWEALLFKLSNNDITKIKDILNLELIFVFNMIGMQREMNLI